MKSGNNFHLQEINSRRWELFYNNFCSLSRDMKTHTQKHSKMTLSDFDFDNIKQISFHCSTGKEHITDDQGNTLEVVKPEDEIKELEQTQAGKDLGWESRRVMITWCTVAGSVIRMKKFQYHTPGGHSHTYQTTSKQFPIQDFVVDPEEDEDDGMIIDNSVNPYAEEDAERDAERNQKAYQNAIDLFYQEHPFAQQYRGQGHDEHDTDSRVAFSDFIDMLHQNGQLSDYQVNEITLDEDEQYTE